ncbi:MAG: hemerythrin domain-containing protein [Archangium sp.]|nr:hemerythrin domain-containing protein [Archangium sp.]
MAKTSDGLITFFTDDHHECDEGWAAVEAAVTAGDKAKANTLWPEFSQRLEHHLKMEEEVLFPAFEAATGMRGGPTYVMRAEHTQMRGVVAEMDRRVKSGDLDGLLDQGDTLLMLIQQHNAKEEGMLYPMAAQVLGAQWGDLAAKLAALP